MDNFDLVVIGGGAAGFFAAVSAKTKNSNLNILIIEKSNKLLSKVLVSGGGRCNLTHACYEPAKLVENYPRGSKELLGPFFQFQPADTIQWFDGHGVKTKVEKDGRVFPASDKSSTIANCLMDQATKLNIRVYENSHANSINYQSKKFEIHLSNNSVISANKVLIATGGISKNANELIDNFGHTIIPPVPSLFTFNIQDPRIEGLLGISVPEVELKISFISTKNKSKEFISKGPLLITHWGISGPAVLKLSALAARYLHEENYKSTVSIDWIPQIPKTEVLNYLYEEKKIHPKKKAESTNINGWMPSRLWKRLIHATGIQADQTWGEISNTKLQKFSEQLKNGIFNISGKGIFKEEFVTCGGVKLSEVNFKTMESKIQPGLYFAGEILDIDGLTGGFNFQSAWTTAWIAAQSIGN